MAIESPLPVNRPFVVRMEGVSRCFDQAGRKTMALRQVDLTIPQGDFLALVGSSGSGKSTLLHILGLLDRPDSGTYHLNGRDVVHLSDDEASAFRSSFIGFVFQSFYLMTHASALENVMLPGMYTGVSGTAMKRRAKELLDQVGLSDRIDYTPAQLSGGQQQRVSIARALFNAPDLLLADEPTGQLDAATSADIMELFTSINNSGTTIVVVTHDPDTALTARRRVLVREGILEPMDNEPSHQLQRVADSEMSITGREQPS